ncbi:response regulator transcription factor [Pelagicoccus sp. SDUM812003]|uniref:response regulator transcription factor n=1 Tax=Pelagicoccus sp. SDUM812003 TaxID=3041267 RepID=UPI00280F9DEC|nr:response regulator transcription factor [Pelagicoccus sp. SDUM812003]MDQ8204927.1 response regulator transcription factor [Pelagicoccus sp. SDUM812003]
MPKILIVEDDEALARGLCDNFACEGYEVAYAADGTTGLDLLLDQGADLVLLDVMLPGIDGFSICETARREGCSMPILMLTAKGQERDVVKGLELGADDYVVKPFSVKELIARVRAFLRRHRCEDQRVFTFGEFILDRDSLRLTREGTEVKLTRKEYQLLEYMVINQGKALSRQGIMASVWGSSVLVTQRSVDRCVTTLRAKIEASPANPRFLQTIRDVGYRFEPQ